MAEFETITARIPFDPYLVAWRLTGDGTVQVWACPFCDRYLDYDQQEIADHLGGRLVP